MLLQIFAGINGLLIPGGAVSIYSSPYAEASNFLYDLAKMDNDAGDIFPIWGKQTWSPEVVLRELWLFM